MNRIYSLVYNVTLGQVQVASELAGGAVVSPRPQQRAGWRRQVMALAVGLLVAGGGLAQTLPSGSVVASGAATIGSVSGSRLDISQVSNKAVIHWGSFGIGANNTVAFTTPDASAVTLNIVGAGGGISQIDGTLSSSGHVFLLNQNGVVFGDTAKVNVAGLVASAAGHTHNEASHQLGQYTFDATGQTSAVTVSAGAVLTAAGPIILLGSKVTNNGTIQSSAGAVNLFGSEVVNDGSITADAGIITMQAGTAAGLDYTGGSSPVLVAGPVLQAGQGAISNTGSLQAVDIHIRSPYQASAINVGGLVTAGSLLELSQGGGGMTLAGSLSSGGQVSINSGSGSVTQTGGGLAARELLLATESGGQATPPAFNAARSVSLSSTANAISSISGDVAGNFEVVNSAANGQLDQLRVAGELDLDATGTVTLSHVAAGTMKAAARELIVTGGVVVGGAADLTARNAALVIDGLEVGGNLQANGVGLRQTGTLDVGGDADLNAGTAALSLHNASVDGDLTASGSVITQTGSLVVGGIADLDSAGAIRLANINAGALDVTTRNQLQIDGGNVTGHAGLSAATSMTLTNLGARSIIAAAGALGASGLTVGTNATLTARAAALSLDNVFVAGNLLGNGVGLTQAGTLNVGGDADLKAGTAALSLHNASVDGDLTASGSVITQTGSLAVGGIADLDSPGAIALSGVIAGALDVTSGHQLQISGGTVTGHAGLSAANEMTLTSLGAGSIAAAANALSASGLTVGTNATLTSRTAPLLLDTVSVGRNLTATGSAITQTGSLTVGGIADLDSPGAIRLANINAGALDVTTGNQLQIAGGNVTGHAGLSAATSMTLTNLGAGSIIAAADALGASGLTVGTNATLTSRSATLSLGNVSAGGNLLANGVGLTQTGTLDVGGDADLNAGTAALSLNNASVDGHLTASGSSITQTGSLAVGGIADLDSPGAIALSGVIAGALDVTSGHQLQISGGTVTGHAGLSAANEMTLTSLGAGSIAAAANALGASGLTVGTNATLTSRTAPLLLDTVSVGRNLTATGSAITQTGSLTVGGIADLDSPGAITLANINAGALDVTTGNQLQIAGGMVTGHAGLSAATSMSLTNLGAGSMTAAANVLSASGLSTRNNAVLTARAAALSLGNVSAGGNLLANGVGLSQTGTLDVGGDADLNAGTAALSLNNANVDGDLAVTGSAITQTGSLAVGGSADLDSPGAIALANVTAAALDVTTGNQLQIAGGMVTGHAGLSAATSMTLTNLGAGSIIAAADALGASGLTVGTNATLTSRSATLSLDNVSAGGNLLANGVGLSQTGTLDVGGDADLNAGTAALSLNNANVDGDLAATGSAITQTGSLAVGGAADLDSPGAIALANVAAAALDVTSGHQLQIAGGTVTGHAGLSAANEMTLTSLGTGSITAAANALSASGLTVGTNATLDAGTAALLLNNVAVGGDLQANGVGLSQTGTLAVDGDATLDAGTAALSLNNVAVGGNLQANGVGLHQTGMLDVGGDADLNAGTAALSLNNSTVDGDLTATGSAITQTGSLAVGGTADLDSGGAIALANVTAAALDVTSGNQLQIAGATVAGGAALDAAGELKLADMSVGGQLQAAATAISQSGALSVGRSSELLAAGAIVLDHAGNQFAGPVALRAQQASIVSAAGLELASVDVAELQASAGGQLAVGTANIAGSARLSGNGVMLGAVTVGSGLQVDSAAGIAQQAALQVQGDTLLNASGAIALENAGNDFVGGVAAQGASIRLADRNTLDARGLGNRGGTGDIHVSANGDLSVTGPGVDAGSGNLTLQSAGGRIVQSAGQIVAGTLQVAAHGEVDLQGDNRIATLDDVAADGLKLVSHGDLRVSGNVQAGSEAVLDVRGGSMQLEGQVAASQLRLLSEGDIVQGTAGVLQADTLSGRSGGRTVLGTAADFVANQIVLLGDFTASGGFSLTNARSLTLGALNGGAFSVNAGTADLTLKVDGGDLLQNGQAPVLAGMSYWWSSGRIGTLLDPIHLVTSADTLQVDYVGAPPAYFHATTLAGAPVGVGGTVNAFSFDAAAREQVAAMWRQPPLGLPAGGEQAAPIGVDGPGMALPAKPTTACAGSSADRLCMP